MNGDVVSPECFEGACSQCDWESCGCVCHFEESIDVVDYEGDDDHDEDAEGD